MPFTYDMFTAEQLEALRGPAGKDGVDGKDGQDGVAGKNGRDGVDGQDGATGQRGTGILRVTTGPGTHSWTEGDNSYSYFGFDLSAVKSQSGMSEVLTGDIILYQDMLYRVSSIARKTVVLVGASYSIRGTTGDSGKDGRDGSDAAVTAENIRSALGYIPANAAASSALNKESLSLGVKDGLIYIFVDGVAVGNGIEQGVTGDVVGYIGEDNTIVLTGAVPEGAVYSVKYEKSDGTVIEIGDLSLEEAVEVVITNQIPLSVGSDGQPFNGGQGWKTGYRISGSSGGESAQTGTEVTGFIPFKYGDTLYIKGIIDDGSHVIGFYKSDYTYATGASFTVIFGGAVNGESAGRVVNDKVTTQIGDQRDNIAFMRVSASEITADSIITVNQPIE